MIYVFNSIKMDFSISCFPVGSMCEWTCSWEESALATLTPPTLLWLTGPARAVESVPGGRKELSAEAARHGHLLHFRNNQLQGDQRPGRESAHRLRHLSVERPVRHPPHPPQRFQPRPLPRNPRQRHHEDLRPLQVSPQNLLKRGRIFFGD